MRDIEEIVISTLNNELDVKVSSDVPENRPTEFVTVELTASPINETIQHATAAIQCWSDKREKAFALANEVVAALPKILEIDYVAKCQIESVYNHPELSGKHHRYQIVANFVTSGN